jgi:hypothetical protein
MNLTLYPLIEAHVRSEADTGGNAILGWFAKELMGDRVSIYVTDTKVASD